MKILLFLMVFTWWNPAPTSLANATVPAITTTVNEAPPKKESIKVYGNCGMCQRRIEGALADVAGISEASWDMETKMLTVKYDGKKISSMQIQQKVAAVGHDTDAVRAPDEVYAKLHGCCQYDRPQN